MWKDLPVFLISFLLLFSVKGVAQISDDFSDGDFLNNPTWEGDIDSFIVNSDFEMQLFATQAGNSSIYLPVTLADSTIWECSVKLDFAPSGSNKVRIWLQSDMTDWANANGYFIEIGQTGSQDSLRFFRQDAGSTTQLYGGPGGTLGSAPAEVRLRIERTAQSEWTILSDYTGGTNLVQEGSFSDNTYTNGPSFFGFDCTYTSGRKEDFFFDDILIDELLADATPPSLLQAEALSATEIRLIFDEDLDPSSIQANAFDIDNGIGTPANAIQDPAADNQILLELTSALQNLETYVIGADGITDLEGNMAGEQFASLFFLLPEQAEANDLLIMEIMADPTPVVQLPDAEFVELYNRSDKVIRLGDLELSSGGAPQVLPDSILLPGAYAILCDDSDQALFAPLGNVVPIPSFPTLSNGGDQVLLTRNGGLIIDEVNYTIDWYQDPEKEEGGYTLERINPNRFCQGSINWSASNDPQGGTPGRQNSQFETDPDVEAPLLINSGFVSNNQIVLTFDEELDEGSLNPDFFTIQPAIEVIDAAYGNSDLEVLLTLSNDLEDGTSYSLSFSDQVRDCSGNPALLNGQNEFTYFLVETASPYDILITEIMADPILEDGGTLGLPGFEYVELYNRSDKVINLQDFSLTNGTQVNSLPRHLLFPGDYLILQDEEESGFGLFGDTLAISSFIPLANTSDQVEISNPAGTLIHAVHYTIAWYRDESRDDGGYSLEMVDETHYCQGSTNWRASQDLLGGTPGQLNSIDPNSIPETPFQLLRAFPVDDSTIRLYFNQAVDQTTANDPTNYQVNPPGLSVNQAFAEAPLFETVLIELDDALSPNQLYAISLDDEYTSCIGERLILNTTFVQLPEAAQEGDLVINELLFNPASGGSRFVELYNRSERAIDLSTFILARREEDTSLGQARAITTPFLVLPLSYAVLTSDTIDICSRYFCESPNRLIQTSIPTYEDREGTVVLYTTRDTSAIIIDEFAYTNALHHPLLDDENGVSLERIRPEAPTQQASSWHSAAESAGFATPTYQNSQFFMENNPTEDLIQIPRTTFSPDEDGFEDFYLIEYQLDIPKYLGSVSIFDLQGRLIRELVRNELLSAEGSFKWDGSLEDGTKAPIGAYVVFIEFLHPDGTVQSWKRQAVIATRF